MATKAELGQAEAKSQELVLGPSCEYKGSNHLCQLPLLFPGHQQRSGWEAQQPGFKPVLLWDSDTIGAALPPRPKVGLYKHNYGPDVVQQVKLL